MCKEYLLLEAIDSTEEGKNKSASSIGSKRKTQRTPPGHISLHITAPKNSRNRKRKKKTPKGALNRPIPITSDLKQSRTILISHDSS